jgi:DNA-binding transcriptional regulator YiaG
MADRQQQVRRFKIIRSGSMPNIAKVLKDEISRLSRKQVKSETSVTRKAAADHRRQIAALKRTVDALGRRIAYLEKREKNRLASVRPESEANGRQVRFSPVWLKRHREKLGFSAASYAQLVGVSALSIYNWENGKAKPRAKQVEALSAIRGLGKREAERRLEVLAKR